MHQPSLDASALRLPVAARPVLIHHVICDRTRVQLVRWRALRHDGRYGSCGSILASERGQPGW